MCTTCGCSDKVHATVTGPETRETAVLHALDGDHRDHVHKDDHHHDHPHEHGRDHNHHEHKHGTTVALQEDVLAKNNRLAERNRGWFAGRNIVAFNLVSAPGSGKTSLLERTLRDLKDELTIQVIEGDQATTKDAERIRATGCKVVQINTGTGCHLEADMLARGLKQLAPPLDSIVMIENVGNLVCPALFDLGERAKIVILSVTEGEDKPIKYPHMFRAAQVMVLNKIDLLPYVDFDVGRCLAYARQVNPGLRVFQLSATKGAGLGDWYTWLRAEIKASPSMVFPLTGTGLSGE